MNEWRRILSDRKRAWLLLLIPVLSLLLFLFTESGGQGFSVLRSLAGEYREMIAACRDRDPAETAKELQRSYAYTAQEIRAEAEHIRDYPAYLTTVQKQAERMAGTSIFGGDKNSYTYRNIIKTAADFARMDAAEVRFGANRAVEHWVDFKWGDLLFLFAIILIVLSFTEAESASLKALIRSTPGGRVQLTLKRLLTLLEASFFFTLLCGGLPLAASFLLYGGADELDRSVQSLVSFKTCTISCSIGEWLLLYGLVKILCGLLLGCVIWLILSFLAQKQLSWLIILAVLAVEYAAYSLIMPQMALSFFRYVNLFQFVHPAEMLRQYVNLNFFGRPVGVLPFMIGLMLIMGTACPLLLCRIAEKRRPFGNRDLLGRIVEKGNRAGDWLRRRMSLAGLEAYKHFVLSGSIVFLAIGVVICLRLNAFAAFYYPENDVQRLYAQYVAMAKGKIGEETDQLIAKAQAALENSSVKDAFQTALDQLERKVEELRAEAEEGGYEPWLLDQTQLKNYMGKKAQPLHRLNGMVTLLFVILSVSPLFAYELGSGTRPLLLATGRGRKSVFRIKCLLAGLETACLWGVVYVREYIQARQLFGENTAAPLGNTDDFAAFLPKLSLGGLLLLMLLVRLFALLAAAAVILWLSLHFSDWMPAAAISVLILFLPAIPYYFGAEAAGWFSLVPFLEGIRIPAGNEPHLLWGLIGLVWAGLACTAVILAYKKWKGSR